MSTAGKVAKFGLKALLLKVIGPYLLAFGALLTVMVFILFLVVTGAVGSKAQQDEEAQSTSSTQCAITASDTKNTGDKRGGTINVPKEYQEPIKKAAEVSGLPEQIVAAQIKQESGFNAQAGSPAGAQGPAQFMPGTWESYGNGGDIHNVADSLDAYGRYMKDLRARLKKHADGDANKEIQLALAGYNAGEGAVEKYQGIPPFSETQNYVKIITGSGQTNFSEDCSAATGGKAWDGDLGKGEWTNPLPGGQFTSGYGGRNVPGLPSWAQQHVGVDLATSPDGAGGKVIAPTDMTIVGFLDSDGCVLSKQKGDPGFFFAFCHMNSWEVKEGQALKRGDVLGIEGTKAGSVGGGVARHLHFEIYDPESADPPYPYNGHNINPEPILKEKGAWVK